MHLKRQGLPQRHIVIIIENAVAVPFGIIELPRSQAPSERQQKDTPQEQRHRYQIKQRGHLSGLIRQALSITRTDELDMNIAAQKGVSSPAMATGTVTTL